jgi:hypothetical protein
MIYGRELSEALGRQSLWETSPAQLSLVADRVDYPIRTSGIGRARCSDEVGRRRITIRSGA